MIRVVFVVFGFRVGFCGNFFVVLLVNEEDVKIRIYVVISGFILLIMCCFFVENECCCFWWGWCVGVFFMDGIGLLWWVLVLWGDFVENCGRFFVLVFLDVCVGILGMVVWNLFRNWFLLLVLWWLFVCLFLGCVVVRKCVCVWWMERLIVSGWFFCLIGYWWLVVVLFVVVGLGCLGGCVVDCWCLICCVGVLLVCCCWVFVMLCWFFWFLGICWGSCWCWWLVFCLLDVGCWVLRWWWLCCVDRCDVSVWWIGRWWSWEVVGWGWRGWEVLVRCLRLGVVFCWSCLFCLWWFVGGSGGWFVLGYCGIGDSYWWWWFVWGGFLC